ncbi:hypothetical protein [Microcella sp.]|uniref:hypothetical protein n=1 Tax=Microcella sp. TaxID=1913979 RepID=UPI003918ECFE
MGKLLFGSQVELDVDDESLFHLDAALAELAPEGIDPRVHASDGHRIVSASGSGIALVYKNGPHLSLDAGLLDTILDVARAGQFLVLPFLTTPFKR